MCPALAGRFFTIWVPREASLKRLINPQNSDYLRIQTLEFSSVSFFSLLLYFIFWTVFSSVQFSSVTQSCPTLCDPMNYRHARPPCPSPTARVYSNSCSLSQWCHPAISPSVIPFSSYLQSFPASGFFISGGQSIRVSASASILPMNIQDWFPLGLPGLISLQSKGLSRVFSNTTAQKHQFFSSQLSL